LWGCILVLHLATPSISQAQGAPYQRDAQAACFEGVDLQQAGDHEGAIARFLLALSYDPALHQAHLLLAESYLELGMQEEARSELTRYLGADFPEADVDRARELMVAAGGDPDAVRPPAVPQPGHWAPAAVAIGAAVDHFDNRIGVTAVGPVIGVGFLPWRHVELEVRAGFGVGPWPDHEGTIRVPILAVGAAASIPLSRVRLVAGARVPMVFSHNHGDTRADGGIEGVAGVRVALVDRIVLEARFAGGYLVRPVIGGSIAVGVQIGPMSR